MTGLEIIDQVFGLMSM